MRIISGTLKGRRIDPPQGLGIRPTTDRAREALFNILAHRISFHELRVLDAFAGSGAVALEFLSRGAAHVTLLEANARVVTYLNETFARLGVHSLVKLIHTRAEALLSNPVATNAYDVIFMDPPYAMAGKEHLLLSTLQNGWLLPAGHLILEHPVAETYLHMPQLKDTRTYGGTAFSWFSLEA